MNLVALVLTAFVEAVAEVLPIDRSGHELLLGTLTGLHAQGVAAAELRIGAALALAVVLWRDLAAVGSGLWRLRKLRIEPGTLLLARALAASLPWLAATAWRPPVPALPGGLWLAGAITVVVAVATIGIDRQSLTVRRLDHLGLGHCLLVGVVQLLALVPGVGRTVAAFAAGRALGLERPAALQLALQVSLPVLLAQAGAGLGQVRAQAWHPGYGDIENLLAAFVLTLAAAGLAQRWARRAAMANFAFYRVAIGAALLAAAALGWRG